MTSVVERLRHFLAELRRRNVYRVAVAYAVVAFVTLQVAELLFPATTLEGLYDEMVLVVFVGFPIALVVAWALELTPEGIRQTEPADKEKMSGRTAGPSTYGWIGAAVLGLLLAGGWWILASEGPGAASSTSGAADSVRTITNRSIAVLPFENLGGTKTGSSLAPGLHEDLLTRLANVSDLQVTSRTSVQEIRDANLTLPAIADTLGVRWVLEGSVQARGEQIDVTAQLIDPRRDVHLWAKSYQRTLSAENLFAIQGEIARQIANALQAQLTAGEQRRIAGAPTEDLEAYRLYVRGRTLLNEATLVSIRQSISYFERALDQDSTFALAWSGLADARGLFGHRAINGREATVDSIRAMLPQQRRAARRAIDLNPALAEARATMGLVHVNEQLVNPGTNQTLQALRQLRRAEQLKPSYAQTHHWLGIFLLELGYENQALAHASRAVELDPQNVPARWTRANALIAKRRYTDALTTARRGEKLFPGRFSEQSLAALAHIKRWDEVRSQAREMLAQHATDSAAVRSIQALRFAVIGDTSAAERLLRQFRGGSPNEKLYMARAAAYEALGREEAAVAALREPFQDATGIPPGYSAKLRYYYPDLLADVRRSEGYETLIREVNEAWGLRPDGSFPEPYQHLLAEHPTP